MGYLLEFHILSQHLKVVVKRNTSRSRASAGQAELSSQLLNRDHQQLTWSTSYDRSKVAVDRLIIRNNRSPEQL